MPIVAYATPGSRRHARRGATLLTAASYVLAAGPAMFYAVVNWRRPDQFTGLFFVLMMPASTFVGLVVGCLAISRREGRSTVGKIAAVIAVVLNAVQIVLLAVWILSRLKW